MPHPFRFAIQAYHTDSAASWRDTARRAEALGYSTLFVADHYLGPGAAMASANHAPQTIAAVPAMMAAASVTSTLRVGARVLGIDYHQPVVLAKELATIDFLSDGRLEIGLGAGWLGAEYDAMGIPFDPPGRRIERLADVVTFIRAYMGEGQLDFQGPSGLRVRGFEGIPKPVQRPLPPIMIGGGGKKVLTLAAQQADIVSFNFNNSSGSAADPRIDGPDEMLRKVGWVQEAAADRFAKLELDIGAYFIRVSDHRDAPEEFVGMLGGTREEILNYPHALIGSVDQICDLLIHRREVYGFSYITVFDTAMEEFAPIVARLHGK
jgi:probable F420-dependent oxidoreductase